MSEQPPTLSAKSRARQRDIERRMPPISNHPSTLPKIFWTGLVVAIVPFFVRIISLSTETVNGVLTKRLMIDYLALGASVLLVLCLLETLRRGGPSGWRVGRDRPSQALIWGAVAVLGIFVVIHALRGFGII